MRSLQSKRTRGRSVKKDNISSSLCQELKKVTIHYKSHIFIGDVLLFLKFVGIFFFGVG